MRILIAHPGSDVSTTDVWAGQRSALLSLGHEVIDYRLDLGITKAGAWLTYEFNGSQYQGKDYPPPTTADILYHAGVWLIQQALRVQPEWVLVISGMFLHPDVVILLRRAHIRVAVLFTESPYDHARELDYARYADVVFTNERASVLGLKQANPNVAYLPHAYDPARHHLHTDRKEPCHCPDCIAHPDRAPHERGRDNCELCPPLKEDVVSHDVIFVGTGFEERVELLEAVDWTGIDLGLYGQWEDIDDDSPLQPFVCGGIVDNAVTAELYRRAKIGLNLYRQLEGWGGVGSRRIGGAESLNPRAYELAACGCFTISDYRAELDERFSGLVPTFETAGELETCIRLWLQSDSREAVAVALAREVAGHTFVDRARYLVKCLEQYQEAEREQVRGRLELVR